MSGFFFLFTIIYYCKVENKPFSTLLSTALLLLINYFFVNNLPRTRLYRKQRKLDKQFGLALQEYLDAARNGTLNLDILNSLISSIEAIEKNFSKKSINLNISAAQFSDLINCIFDFTKRLAEANNFNTNSINRPKYFKKKTSEDLKYYLNMQKQIFEQAA